MRVTTGSIDDFLANLRAAKPEQVLQRIVYVDVRNTPVGADSAGMKSSVIIQATAVIAMPEGGEYLLVGGEACGFDYRDNGGEYPGSERAGELKTEVERYCGTVGLAVRPGSVSE